MRILQRRLASAILVGLAGCAVYLGVLGHELVWDDHRLYEVIEIRTATEGWIGLLSAPFALSAETHTNYYRPAVILTLWAETGWGSGRALAAHTTNVILHGVASGLACLLLAGCGLPRRSAWIGGLVFALHPVHVESVAFVSGRTDLLAAVFALVSAILWARSRTDGTARRGVMLASGALAFLLGCLSKEVVWMLPAVLLAWDAMGFPRPHRPSAWRDRNLPWIAVWAGVLAVTLAIRFAVFGGFPMLEDPVRDPTNQDWSWMTLPGVVVHSLSLLVIPWPLQAYYTPDQLDLDPLHLFGAFAVVGLCLGAAGRRFRRAGLAALCWILGFLLPVSGIVPIPGAVLAERFLYLPSLGFSLLVAAWLTRPVAEWDREDRRDAMSVSLVAVMLVLFAAGSVVRSRVWKSDLSLFENVVRTTPGYAEGHMNLAIEYGERGRKEEAIVILERLVRERPDAWMARINLGIQYADTGRVSEAIDEFRSALAHNPSSPEALFNLGLAELRMGRLREAEDVFRKCVSVVPSHARAWHGWGVTALRLGQPRQAETALRKALRYGPELTEARAVLGHVLAETGREAEARREFEEALRTEPRNATALYGTALLALRSGDRREMERLQQRLREVDPDLARQLRNVATDVPGTPPISP